MRRVRGGALLLGLWMAGAGPALAQDPDLRTALEFERRGNYSAAAGAYQAVLEARPAHVNALLGLERVLGQQGRPAAMTGAVAAALAANPEDPVVYGIAIRAWMAAGAPDTVARMVERWAAVEPGSEAPWREWGFAALTVRDRTTAMAAYRAGRARLGVPALAAELAQLATVEGDYTTAAVEWVHAIDETAAYHSSAVGALSQAPGDRQGPVLAALDRLGRPAAHQLAAALAVRWGDPARGQALLLRSLPEGPEGAAALHRFLDELRLGAGPAVALARGRTLERLADFPGEDRPRWLADAARAYADAQNQEAARRVLGRLAADPGATARVAGSAAVTLVGVLIAEGSLAEAERRLDELGTTVPIDERERLRQDLALARLRAGDLDRAERLLVGDSSMAGAGIRGRILLARGDLKGATADLIAAGPFPDDRREATDRTSLLAVLQMIETDALPGLGAAYLALVQGDSLRAAGALEAVAAELPPAAGGGELRVWAGQLLAGHDPARAERLFAAAEQGSSPAAAAAASYERAALLLRRGAVTDAVPLLEAVILAHPGSVVAPLARRLLDQARGRIPAR